GRLGPDLRRGFRTDRRRLRRCRLRRARAPCRRQLSTAGRPARGHAFEEEPMGTTTLERTSFTVTPVSGGLGAEIGDIDLARPQAPEVYGQLKQALAENGVIFFRDQTLEPAQLLAFAEKFGTPQSSRFG